MKFMMSLLVLTLAMTAQAKHGIMHTLNRVTPNTTVGAKDTNLMYYGGPVISSVKLYTVFWGSKIDPTITKGIPAFYSAYVSSGQMDWLNQYTTKTHSIDGRQGTNQSIGRGTYGGEIVITPKNTNTSLADADVQAELEYQVAQNVLPKPDENSLYMIHFPSNVTISIDGMASCASFCAYHEGFKSKQFGDIFYGVMPDLGAGACSFTCAMGGDTLSSTTFVSSHELAEAVTDPYPTPASSPTFPQAWNDTAGAEIGDKCQDSSTLTSGGTVFTITKLWDNSTSSCSTQAW